MLGQVPLMPFWAALKFFSPVTLNWFLSVSLKVALNLDKPITLK